MANSKNETQDYDYEPENPRKAKSLSVQEQEVCINFMRDEDFATIYVSDSTYITKIDKLCKSNPDMWSVIDETAVSRTYRVEDKNLISFRSKKREISEEQRTASSERMRKYQERKRDRNTVLP